MSRNLMCCATLAAVAAPVLAHEPHTPAVEELVVYGRSEQQIGVAVSASEGLVGYEDIRLPPLLRAGELVESVPGMVATQHSGTGKANQYFLRGFNLDHGTDFSAHVEGIPVNLPTHGHGHGYLDLNFLIPEMVATTRYRKGPYHADTGDFSSAGSVDFRYYERLPETLLTATVGEDDYLRGLIAGSTDAASGVLTGALDVTRYAGPWQLDENLETDKFQVAYARDLGDAHLRLRVEGYQGDWDATDQIPLRAVTSGLIDELGYIDPDLGGHSERYSLSAALEYPAWSATAYLIDYELALYSNFTYYLDDPVTGDEFEQRDQRQVYGLRIEGGRDARLARTPVGLRWGLEGRVDDIDEVGLYRTAARQRNDLIRQDSVEQRSVAAYGEIGAAFTERLRGTAGLRASYYDWDVDAARSPNSGSGDDSLFTPKASLAYLLSDGLEAYANWGRGFHSNDVRGATIEVDPVSGDAVDAVPVLVESEGAELGLRFERGQAFNASLVGFWLELDSELVFVGDAGTTEPNGATERTGIELSSFWQATDWLAMDATYTYTDAAYQDEPASADSIPGAVKETFSLGLNGLWPNGFSASARLRYLGETPLVEDDSVRADSSLLVNAGVGYRFDALELRLDVFNLLDSDDYDISYYYASRLPGEPAEGVEDIHFHPLKPRTVRASVTYHL